MSLWRQFTAGLRVLTRRNAADRDVRDEVADFLERSAAEHRARGLSPEDARRAARLEIGSETMAREQVRGYGWENLLSTFFADLRHGARQLRRAPGFTAVTVFTLALGIGATTTIFSAVNPILFRALPYPHAERILSIYDAGDGGAHRMGTFATYTELAARNHTLECDRGDEAVAADAHRIRRARTARWTARERELLPRARDRAGDRTGPQRIRRPPQRPRRRAAQRRVVAPAVQWRPRDRGAHRQSR